MASRLSQYIVVAQVLKPQGIRGELKLKSLTDDPDRFTDLKYVFVMENGQYLKRMFSLVRIQDDFVYANLEGCFDRNAAEVLRNQYLYVDRKNAVQLPENRWFIVDLIGCSVYDEKGEIIGKLTDVIKTGANDVYVIEGDSIQWMLPVVEDALIDVDVENGVIHVTRSRLCEVDAGAY